MACRGAGLVRRGRVAGACALLRPPSDFAVGRRRFLEREISSRATPSSFAIAFDIDGVLLRGGLPIGGALGALRRLYDDPANPAKLRIPYIFLTNGGGSTEASKAIELSEQLDVPVLPDQVLLGHTPFRKLADKFKNQRVLAIGRCEPDIVLRNYGFQHVVNIDSYVHEFEHIDGLARFKPWNQSVNKVVADLLPDHLALIAGVFVVSDPYEWNRDIQVICDVLRSGGRPGREGVPGQPQPPLFFAADDMDYQSVFPIPRLGMGAFRVGLESIYNRLPGAPLHSVSYGKPQLMVYKNAEHALEEVSTNITGISAEVSAVSKHSSFKSIYMIGDNPTTDIIGAKFAGHPWFSILTRTGCYRGQPISSLYDADKVVEDVEEAVDFIMQRENMS
ncbi:hypothetical protein R1flu_017690 [Riccia fluitans]|uniref:Uncharacterized protein n=1 Tax=Riccia fluitans TaxID=41844 RepID=A0ABD1ZDP0_9MARC